MKRALFVLALATLTLCTLANQTHAQTIPLPYGTVEYIGHQGPNYAYACNTANGWYPLTTCIDATMHCDASLAVDDITFTFGYESPTAPYRGTIAVLSGAGGMTPATSTGHEIDAIKAYLADGFEIVQVQWDANWEAAKSFYIPDTFGNIQAAACRPAGFLQFVHSSTNPVLLQPGGGMCAHGLSARLGRRGVCVGVVRGRLGIDWLPRQCGTSLRAGTQCGRSGLQSTGCTKRECMLWHPGL